MTTLEIAKCQGILHYQVLENIRHILKINGWILSNTSYQEGIYNISGGLLEEVILRSNSRAKERLQDSLRGCSQAFK